jgi:hypothetical protein
MEGGTTTDFMSFSDTRLLRDDRLAAALYKKGLSGMLCTKNPS